MNGCFPAPLFKACVDPYDVAPLGIRLYVKRLNEYERGAILESPFVFF